MPLPRLSSGRLAALLVGAVYVVLTTALGGADALLVAILLSGGAILFIWFGPEVGEAIALSPEPGRRTTAGLVLQAGGWLLLVGLVAGFAWKTFG